MKLWKVLTYVWRDCEQVGTKRTSFFFLPVTDYDYSDYVARRYNSKRQSRNMTQVGDIVMLMTYSWWQN